MAKQNGQNSWKEVVSLLHFNEKSGSYKKLSVCLSEDGGVMISLSEGKKGDKENAVKINFSLNRQELIYLAKELELIYSQAPTALTK